MDEKYERFRHFSLLTAIPTVMVAGPIVGYGIGYFFDRWFSTDPWGMVFFSLMGIVSGARETVRLIRRVERAQRDEQPPAPPPSKQPSSPPHRPNRAL